MGSFTEGEKSQIQTLQEQKLGAKAIVAAYREKEFFGLSSRVSSSSIEFELS